MSSLLPNDPSHALEVYALPTGQLYHPDRWLFEDGDPDLMNARHPYPNYSFLIRHPSGKSVMFDLGLRKDLENVPTLIRSNFKYVTPVVAEDVVDALTRGPVSPANIDVVIFSHLHFDHVGDCTKFPEAQVIAGPGSRAASSPGFPVDPNSPFESSVIAHKHYHELGFETDAWQCLGPFNRAHDFFGDQTLFLVDTPGHMAGHLGALVYTGPDEWVFMGGDCCHHRSILTGSRPMSLTMGPGGRCFHRDAVEASKTIAKIRMLDKTGQVLVALAHDSYLVGKMPEYPEKLNGWKASVWKKELDTVLSKDYDSRTPA